MILFFLLNSTFQNMFTNILICQLKFIIVWKDWRTTYKLIIKIYFYGYICLAFFTLESTYKKCLREEWGKFTGYQLLSSFWLKVARTDEDGNMTSWDRGTLPIRNLYPKWWMLRFGRIRKVTNWIWILWFIVSYWWVT